jgi:Zn-dependent protease
MLWAINMVALILVLGIVAAVLVGFVLIPLSKLYYYLEEIPDETCIDSIRDAPGDERTSKSSVRRLHVD